MNAIKRVYSSTKKKDFMTGHSQMDYHTDLAKYYDALERYVDYLESIKK